MDERLLKWPETDRLTLNSIYGAGFNDGMQLVDQLFPAPIPKFSNHALPEIKNVIFNNPATIVFWSDGTKTVVKCQYDDVFDREKGLAMAICKKVFGNKGNYCNQLKKWLPKEEEPKWSNPYAKAEPLWDQITEAFRKAGEAVAGN